MNVSGELSRILSGIADIRYIAAGKRPPAGNFVSAEHYFQPGNGQTAKASTERTGGSSRAACGERRRGYRKRPVRGGHIAGGKVALALGNVYFYGVGSGSNRLCWNSVQIILYRRYIAHACFGAVAEPARFNGRSKRKPGVLGIGGRVEYEVIRNGGAVVYRVQPAADVACRIVVLALCHIYEHLYRFRFYGYGYFDVGAAEIVQGYYFADSLSSVIYGNGNGFFLAVISAILRGGECEQVGGNVALYDSEFPAAREYSRLAVIPLRDVRRYGVGSGNNGVCFISVAVVFQCDSACAGDSGLHSDFRFLWRAVVFKV